MRDSKEGVRLLLAAANAGHDVAVPEIGRLYSAIRPVISEAGVDGDEAVLWLRRAAAMGEARAQYRLGRRFLHGLDVLEDPAQGHVWMLKAAAAGHDGAPHYVDYMYQEGHGVLRDGDEDRRWLQLTADSGNTFAQAQLPRDVPQAQSEGSGPLQAGLRYLSQPARPDHYQHEGQGGTGHGQQAAQVREPDPEQWAGLLSPQISDLKRATHDDAGCLKLIVPAG